MKKSVILVLACIIAAVLLILTTGLITSVVHEKNSTEREKYAIQAVNLCEAGLNHGIAQLRKKILGDLNTVVGAITNSATISAYADGDITDDDSLDFLCDMLGFTYVTGSSDEVEITFSSTAVALDTAIQGSYTGRIVVRKQRDVSGNPIEGYCPGGTIYRFPYEFLVEASASSSSVNKNLRFLSGKFEATVQRGSFARYALFTVNHSTPSGSNVWFTANTNFAGPVHTNQRFNFANNPSGHFTAETTQHLTKARFYNNGWPILMDAVSNPGIDVPIFEQGFNRGVGILNLESAITADDLRDQALGDMSQPAANGIYIPNDGANLTGGIYVRGDSTVDMGIDSSNTVYTIVQGGTTKIITIDQGSNQTTVKEGVDEVVYSGLPDGINGDGIILFDDGDITGLGGTVQEDAQATIASHGDIVVTNHIRYERYDTSPSLNAENYTNLLGILAWNGDVRIDTAAPSNLDIHSIVMAPHGVFTVDNYSSRSPSGNVNLLGGAITQFYGAFGTFWGETQMSGYGRNFVYDQRMLGAASPPYYPTLTYFIVTCSDLEKVLDDMGLIWHDQS